MNINKLFWILVYVCLFNGTTTCTTLNNDSDKILIEGRLSNLPDGIVNLLDTKRQIMNSRKTQAGKFIIQLSKLKYPEPVYVEIEHIESKTGLKRLIQFKTSDKFRQSQYFMLENGVVIGDSLEDFTPINIVLPKNIRLVTVSQRIPTGRQNQIMYDKSLNFSIITNVSKIKGLIKEHPYSYYYLYELKKRVAAFSNTQFLSLLDCFDKDVQESKTGRELRDYILNRDTKKLDFTATLVDRQGQKQPILDKSASLNMVILWASWCGPCRKEIPQLKKIHALFASNPKLSMVSISLDEDKDNWYKALDKEKMPWKQLLITPEATTYSKELFSFDGSIPTTLFVDNKGEIIKKFVGYNEKSLEEFEALIEQYTVSKKRNSL